VSTDLNEAIKLAHTALSRRYGKLEIISSKGVPRGQRVRFVYEGKPVRCVIKYSSAKSEGRISFAYSPSDDTFSGLSDSDVVAVVGPSSSDGQDLLLSFYKQASLLKAFKANREALKQSGNSEGGQSWLTPFPVEGRGFRGTGDGFLKEALWTEILDPATAQTENASAQLAPPQLVLTIKEAKEALARKYDVSPDAIDITIRG
jgi:hypothetical protein